MLAGFTVMGTLEDFPFRRVSFVFLTTIRVPEPEEETVPLSPAVIVVLEFVELPGAFGVPVGPGVAETGEADGFGEEEGDGVKEENGVICPASSDGSGAAVAGDVSGEKEFAGVAGSGV